MSKAELLERWYTRVYIDGDIDAVDDLFTETVQARGLLDDMQVGREDIHVFAMALVNLVDAPKLRLVKTVESGDWVAALIEAEGKRVRDGAPLRVMGQLMARFEGDRVSEAYNSFDFMALFQQLGLLPEDALVLGMTGQKIA
jgi:hypothetical protein